MSTATSKGTAAITGASSGIGKVYADRLAKQGYNLHLVARREDKLKELATALTSAYGITVNTTAADLTNPTHLDSLASGLAADTTLTLLVNNAGTSLFSTIADTDNAKADAMVALNITALTRLTVAALSGFKARNSGTLINIGSVVAYGVYPGVGIYNGTKAYVANFTRTLQAELADTNIRVQLVAPAATVSEIWEVSGGSLDLVPAEAVMTTDHCVDAALAGLAAGEAITVPPVEDATLITKHIAAGDAVFTASMTGKPATRYGLAL